MSLREFTDPEGTQWRVWDVRPNNDRRVERRVTERRSASPIIQYSGDERRSGSDRRVQPGPSRVVPHREWLAFESDQEKRRLMQVPPNWDEVPDEELQRLCARATPAPRLTNVEIPSLENARDHAP